MTSVEKAAYLKGLVEGLGIEPDSRDGKLWGALTELLSDMAHEIEDLHESDMDHAEVLDELADELSYLEEITCDLDSPDDFMDDYEDDFECDGECSSCAERCSLADEDDFEDDEPEYDGIIYDATCPVCGEEISFDEETLEEGSIVCPKCGELLEFDLGEDDEGEDD